MNEIHSLFKMLSKDNFRILEISVFTNIFDYFDLHIFLGNCICGGG